MKSLKRKTWQHETTAIDGNTILFGVNIFEKVNIKGEEYEFAAGEFSNAVFGFYIEKY